MVIILFTKTSHFTSDKPHYENEPFNIPKSWIMAQMSDLFLLNPKSEINDNTEIGFIPMACVDDGFSGKHSFEIRNWGDVKKGYCHFQDGDIGVAKISPCFENLKSCILQSLPNGVGTGTTELVILRSLGVYAPFYLYLFKSSWYISQGTKYFKGVVGQQRVNKAIFTELEVPLPSVAEQERIVAEIKRWFGLIDLIEKDKFNLANNIKLAKSKILDLAIHGKLVPQDPMDEPAAELLKRINPKAEIACDNGHYQKLPEGWCKCSFDDIFNITMGQSPNGCSINHQQGVEFHQGKILFGNKYLKSSNMFTEEATKLAKPNSLLLCVRAPVGVVNITQREICIGRGLCSLKPNAAINLDYAYHALTTYQPIFESKSTGSTFKAISGSIIRNEVFSLPPLQEQYRIVAKIEKLFTQLDYISAAL